MSSYRITSVDHVSTLPHPMPSPSLATAPDGTRYASGPGLIRFRESGVPETLNVPGSGVPVDAGVTVDQDGRLRFFGGHPEGDERGALNSVDVLLAEESPSFFRADSMPGRRRGILAVPVGAKKVALFGGLDEKGYPKTNVWLSSPEGVRALRVTLPASGAYMQAGTTHRGVYLLGSGTHGADMLAFRDGEGNPAVTVTEPLSPEGPRHGIATAQDGDAGFYFFGGKDDRSASATLWHYSEERGTERVGTVALGETAWAMAYAAMWVDGNSVVIVPGTRYTRSASAFGGSNPVAEARVIRVGVERT